MDVAIIGGGVTGLSAAYELERRGISLTLLEASSRLGGLIRTEYIDGFTIEAGPESVLAQKPAALQLCEDLGLGPRIVSTLTPRTAFILNGSRLVPIPSPSLLGIPLTLKGILDYDLLPPLARLRLALEPFVPRTGASGDESIASFFGRRFGRATVPLIAAPLLGGIHAGRIDALSMRSLFPRFVDAETSHGSVLRAFRHSQAGPVADGAFRSLSSGMGELVSAIGRRLPPGCVRLASGATTLSKTEEGWRVGTPQGNVDALSVVLAAPAYAAARLLTAVDQESSALCAAIPYVSTVSVAMAFSREQVAHSLEGSGFVVARTENAPRVTACTWVSSKWAGRAPQGSVLLRAFLGSAADASAIDLSDDEVIDVVRRELSTVLRISGAPLLARVHRWHDAGAQHNVGHLERIARLEARLARQPGLFVAGSGFRAIGIPDCVTDGRSAAAAAAEFVRQRASTQV